MPKKLTAKEIQKYSQRLSEWKVNTKQTEITAEFKTKDFVEGLIFLARVTVRAEMMNHHPDVTVSYGKVKVKLTTHDIKGLTVIDFKLAEQISEIFSAHGTT